MIQALNILCKLFIKRKMSTLLPPESVRGMTKLDPVAFTKTVPIPTIEITDTYNSWSKIIKCLKKHLLKMDNLKPVRLIENRKTVFLNPDIVKTFNDLETAALLEHGVSERNFSIENIILNYENWKADDILNAVLPCGQGGLSSYSRIGHIIHVNLKDHLLPYKSLIGRVLLDKTVNCRTVVNKLQNIDNTYRNFQMELLCGEENYLVQVKEHGISFDFDFSSVYWNPRLSSEHVRIVKKLKPGDILYDACAGVGPFSVPAAKKECIVLANDLNPNSFKWLEHNAKKNKVTHIKCFNKDAREFLKEDVKNDLENNWQQSFQGSIHVTMNLPAMAVEFLNVFNGLFEHDTKFSNMEHLSLPTVHVYCFIKAEDNHADLAKRLVEEHLGFEIGDSLKEIFFVRNVSPNKEMICVSFQLTREILFSASGVKRKLSESLLVDEADTADSKRKCNHEI